MSNFAKHTTILPQSQLENIIFKLCVLLFPVNAAKGWKDTDYHCTLESSTIDF